MRAILVPLTFLTVGVATALGQFSISATEPAPGALVYSVANIPPGTTAGRTFLSFDTTLPVGTGAMLGLNLDFPSFLNQAAAPVQPGNPLGWSYPTAPTLFPDTPFTLPAGSLPPGVRFDLLGIAFGPGLPAAISNVARYASGPTASTMNIVENTPFDLTFPAVSTNPLDFCTVLMDPAGRFERVLLAPNPTGGWLARTRRGAVPSTGPNTLMIGEGIGAMVPQTAQGPLTLTTQTWTGTLPNGQSLPGLTSAGTGTVGGPPCTITSCVNYGGNAVVTGGGMATATWSVTIPSGALACLCLPTTEILFDLHGHLVNTSGATSRLDFDTFISGTNSNSTNPCLCLGQVMAQFANTVVAQTAGQVVAFSSCTQDAAGDYVVTISFSVFGGGTWSVPPFGNLRICP